MGLCGVKDSGSIDKAEEVRVVELRSCRRGEGERNEEKRKKNQRLLK